VNAPPGGVELAVEERDGGAAGVSLVSAKGEIDLAVADEVDGALRAAAAGGRAVVVDLRELDFLDSSGLRVLLLAARDLDERFAVVVEPGSAVARLIELAEVADRVRCHASPDEALAALSPGGGEGGG
jgi:anti-sigma B factor antagonist